MEHNIWYDQENGIVHFEVVGDYMQNDVQPTHEKIVSLLEGKSYRQLLITMNKSSKLENRETRNLTNEAMREGNISQIAYVGASSVVRVMAKILLKTGGSTVQGDFFKTKDDAINWLKSKR